MTIALITDTHFGVKNDHPAFIEHQLKFYREVFFPTLEERGVQQIIHLGDIFDRRKYTNHMTLQKFMVGFFGMLEARGIHMYLLIGNHDIYYKNTNEVNSPNLFLSDLDCVTLIEEKPQILQMEGRSFAFVPWINAANYHESLEFMDDAAARGVKTLCGHFEIKGFQMHRDGATCTSGLKAEIFEDFDQVLSGHFHEPSTDGRITYLGAPYEYTWADFDCQRGFHLMDPDTGELEFVRNPDHMFYRITYDELFDPTEYDIEQLRGKIVRIIVAERDTKEFEQFVEAISNVDPLSLEVIDNLDYHVDEDKLDQDAVKNEDTLGIVESYVSEVEIPLDKARLKTEFKSLYMEALAVE